MSIREVSITRARKALWHLRHGGVSQLRDFLHRRQGASEVNTKWYLTGSLNDVAPWPLPDPAEGRHRLKSGVILDAFSALAFAYEWDQVPLDPMAWRDQLDGLDLLFVESAWHGNDNLWAFQLTGTRGPSPELRQLVAECRSRGIPTVFWNKEDPVHFDDFLQTARLFDRVYTTDSSCLERYAQELEHSNVGALAFAAQPSIHNPIRPVGFSPEAMSDVAFAGTYFAHKYPERREQMDMLLGGALDVDSKLTHGGLDIFSRFSEVDPRYQFPKPYADRVIGEASYEQMLTLYRQYRVFLNVNSVVGSPSMCARRIFEITACGTPVISGLSPAIENFFEPDMVFQVDSREEAGHAVRALASSPELRDYSIHRAQHRIWREHTYTARVDQILTDVGLTDRLWKPPSVTAMISTNRPEQVSPVLRRMAAQKDVDLQIVILTHGFLPSDRDREIGDSIGRDLTWLTADSVVTLGGCYNRILEVAEGDVVAKIDDDDLYSPDYLFDQLSSMNFSGAEVVGKGAHYVHLVDRDNTVLRFPDFENRFAHFVSGPTIVAKRSLALDVGFPEAGRGEDTGFLRGVLDAGGRIYSGNRFEFVQMRGGEGGAHTWSIGDWEILATGIAQPRGALGPTGL